MAIVLNMIVKNEAHCIRKCLESVRNHIDFWVIVDTGSTDGTQKVIKSFFNDNPKGALIERPWVNFAHNRNEALRYANAASDEGDYILFIDADEHFKGPSANGIQTPTGSDGYYLNVEYAGTQYKRLALVRAHRPWEWRGAVHEYIHMDNAKTSSLAAPTIVVEHTGARSLDPDTYKKDAALLLEEYKKDPTNARTVFYLAQSYRDSGDINNAIAYYQKRTLMDNGWWQEKYVSQYNIGVLTERKNRHHDARREYLYAYELDPRRAEPLIALSKRHRDAREFNTALLYAKAATEKKVDPNMLFVEQAAYTWQPWDEVAVSAFYTGDYTLGELAARQALEHCPSDPRLVENLKHYIERKKT